MSMTLIFAIITITLALIFYSIGVWSEQYQATSLKRFRDKYIARIGDCYIIHPKNLIVNDGIICIPPYMTMCL